MTRALAWAFALLAAATWLLMISMFAVQSLPVWQHSGLQYLTGSEWFFRAERFGILPMIYGTLAVSMIAITLASPIGLGTALFLSEILPRRSRWLAKSVVELLAGIPSVVYGLLGVLLLRNWIYEILTPFDPLSGDTLLTAGVLLAVMILPTVTTLADDALHGVPGSQRQAARGLGLSRAQTTVSICLPQALPGLISAVLLALGRALGETIAVYMVIGRQDNQWPDSWLSPRPLAEAGQTLTSKLGGAETFIAYGDPLHWAAIVGLAMVLLVLTAGVTLAGARLMRSSRV